MASIVMSTSECVSVCLRTYLQNHMCNFYEIFCACCLLQCLGPPSAGWCNPKGKGQFTWHPNEALHQCIRLNNTTHTFYTPLSVSVVAMVIKLLLLTGTLFLVVLRRWNRWKCDVDWWRDDDDRGATWCSACSQSTSVHSQHSFLIVTMSYDVLRDAQPAASQHQLTVNIHFSLWLWALTCHVMLSLQPININIHFSLWALTCCTLWEYFPSSFSLWLWALQLLPCYWHCNCTSEIISVFTSAYVLMYSNNNTVFVTVNEVIRYSKMDNSIQIQILLHK